MAFPDSSRETDLARAVINLQQQPPVSQKYMFGLVGQTTNGRTVPFPSSYEKGYFDALLPPSNRPVYILNLIIIGQLSNGSWVFPPSYDAGVQGGLQALKFAVLAEGERRLFNEMHSLRNSHASEIAMFEARIKELEAKLNSLTDKGDSN